MTSLLQLQRSAGNAAVGFLLGARSERSGHRLSFDDSKLRDVAGSEDVRKSPPATSDGTAIQRERLLGIEAMARRPLAVVQRSIVVENPTTPLSGSPPRQAWEDVRDALARICPGTTVDSSGTVRATEQCSPSAQRPARTGCQCVCDLQASPNPEPWKIQIIEEPTSSTNEGDRRVLVDQSRTIFERGRWGGGPNAGTRVFVDQARTMAHELCGHAWLMERGTHPPRGPIVDGGRPDHDPTVAIENQIGVEMDGPGTVRRGSFADPHHGESLYRVTLSGYASNATGLSSEMRARLTTIARFLRSPEGRSYRADIIGHADRTGSGAVNERISRQRAINVRAFLVGQQINPARFLVNVGKSFDECPTAPGGNAECRKVEVYVFRFNAASESHTARSSTGNNTSIPVGPQPSHFE